MAVHPTAVVDPTAVLDADVEVGPWCVVGPNVVLGQGVRLVSHVVVQQDTTVGAGTIIHPFAVIGGDPQHNGYKGEPVRLEIGSNNVIREHCTFNRGTPQGAGVTVVGSNSLFMTGAHVGHDCVVGDQVVMANNATLGGHARIGDKVFLGGLCAVHQNGRVGQGAIIGAVTMVTNDVLPHGLVQGPRGVLDGLNLVGLKRRGASRADMADLRAALARLHAGSFRDTAREMAAGENAAMVQEMLDFILGPSDRSFLKPL